MMAITHLHLLLQLLHADDVRLDGVVDQVEVLGGHLLDSQARLFEFRGGLILAVGVEVHLHGEVPGVLQVLQLVLEGYAEAHRPVISAFSSYFYCLHAWPEGFGRKVIF